MLNALASSKKWLNAMLELDALYYLHLTLYNSLYVSFFVLKKVFHFLQFFCNLFAIFLQFFWGSAFAVFWGLAVATLQLF